MGFKASKVEVLDIKLETKTGSLARVLRGIQEAGVNLQCVWGYEMGPSEANAHLVTKELTKAKDVLIKMGLKPTTSFACLVEGDDKLGAYVETLNKIEKAGINIHATDALAAGGKFASIYFVDQKDVGNLCKALGC